MVWMNSLDQDPPEAAEAGAVWHFTRVRYSHFLLNHAYVVSMKILSRFTIYRNSILSLTLLFPRFVRVWISEDTLAHTRHTGRPILKFSTSSSILDESSLDHRPLSGGPRSIYSQEDLFHD